MSSGVKKSAMKLSTVFFLMFCFIAGGAYGIEDMIGEAGPGMTILLLILLPIFWGGPYGLICAELGSIYPEEGGFYVWVREAMGEFWGFQCGWWYTIMSYVDTAVYLVLSVAYVEAFIELSPAAHYALIIGIAVLFTYINIKGIEAVGTSTVVLAIITLIPFLILTIMGFAKWRFNPISPFVAPGGSVLGSFGLALVIGTWMYSGYESMSTLAGEIEDADRLIPKGLLLVMPFVAISYILPTIAGLAAAGQWTDWAAEEGLSFVEIGGMVGGTPLLVIFVIGAVVANLAMYNDYVASSSRAPYVMAEDNLFPKIMNKIHPKYGTPYIAIYSMTIITALLTMLGSFETLIVIDVFLYMFCLILIFISAIILRVKKPELHRPYKVPLGTKGFIVMTIFPIAVAVIALFTNGIEYIIGGTIGAISGPIAYYFIKKKYGGLDKAKASN